MKYFIIALLAMGVAACQNEPKSSTASDIERMRAEIEKKRNEITDQKELARLEEEAKHLDAELKQLGGSTTTSSAPKTTGQAAPSGGNTGTIKGNSVTVRKAASTQADKLGAFDNNEVVTILNQQRADNAGEAILKTPVDLYTGANGTGDKSVALPKGKAVFVERYDAANQKVYISYQHPEKGKLYAMIASDAIEDIESSIWYQVKRTNGQTGWVFGKFITVN
jgi:hypothetical protein